MHSIVSGGGSVDNNFLQKGSSLSFKESWISNVKEYVNKKQEEPRPPAGPKPSMRNESKSLVFEPYRSTRPVLLAELNAILDKGLKNQTDSEDSSMQNLQVYRDAFEVFIENFNIYRQFLTAVKHEYDSALESYSHELGNISALRTELATKEQEYSMIVRNIEQAHDEKLRLLNETVATGQKQMSLFKKDMKKTVSEKVAAENELSTLKKEFFELKASCVTITNSLSRLELERRTTQSKETSRNNEYQLLKSSSQRAQEEVDRLRVQVQDLEKIQSQSVNQDVVGDYVTTIETLREEARKREVVHKDFVYRYSLLKSAIDASWAKAGGALPGSVRSASAELDTNEPTMLHLQDLVERYDPSSRFNVTKTNTPRVLVESLLTDLAGAKKTISQLTSIDDKQGKTDEVLVDGDIIFAAKDGLPSSPWEHYEGLGLSTVVPKYLRYEGTLQQLSLSKWETESCVNQIWAAKERLDSFKAPKVVSYGISHDFDPSVEGGSFGDFYNDFINEKFNHNRAKAVEFSYNFIDALKKFSYDSDCKLMYLILNGQLCEDIRHDQLKLIEHVQEEFSREEALIHAHMNNTLPVSLLNKIIRRLLMYKTEQSFVRLEKALMLETKGNRQVNYVKILGEDEEGNQGTYCEMLRNQHLQESINFGDHLVNMITQKYRNVNASKVASASPFHAAAAAQAQPTNSGNNMLNTIPGELCVGDIREALVYADKNKTRSEINRYLARGSFCTVEEMLVMEVKKTMVPLDLFIKRLRRGLLFPSLPLPDKRGKL